METQALARNADWMGVMLSSGFFEDENGNPIPGTGCPRRLRMICDKH
jgi:hypothetical protein